MKMFITVAVILLLQTALEFHVPINSDKTLISTIIMWIPVICRIPQPLNYIGINVKPIGYLWCDTLISMLAAYILVLGGDVHIKNILVLAAIKLLYAGICIYDHTKYVRTVHIEYEKGDE